LRIHRAARLRDDEITEQQGIRVTTVARTLFDLASSMPGRALERALDEDGDPTLTDSELEELMLALCHEHQLEQPIPQAWVAGLRVDFLFAASRLVVETDGYRYHRTRRAFERDRERDAILARAGHRTLRVTHRQLTKRGPEVAATIRSSA
jgi:very-short-patch-repair endonuclease